MNPPPTAQPVITRDLDTAPDRPFGVAIVGGGIYGVMLTLEAARRGLRPLLLDAQDFNSGVSWNSLRVLHGGLRYLQTMDLPRFFESVGERRWFLKHYPEHTGVLDCLMPLYGQGLRRPSTFGVALRMNDTLSCRRNAGVAPSHHLRRGRIVSAEQTRERFAAVDRDGLQGAGLWYDGFMANHQRLYMELLRWAVSAGATAWNYCRVTGLTTDGGRVTGLEAIDAQSGRSVRVAADHFVNAAGPACRAFASDAEGQDARGLSKLFSPSLAFNLLIDREPLSDCALALTPKAKGARSYFVLPWNGRVLAGTFHTPWTGPADAEPRPDESLIAEFLSDVNRCVPGLDWRPEDVRRVLSGLLPAAEPGAAETAHRAVCHDHSKAGGPRGLFSVSGVKYTTARLEAQRTLQRVFGKALPGYRPEAGRPEVVAHPRGYDGWARFDGSSEAIALAGSLAEAECARSIDDIVHRRTDWGADPEEARRVVGLLREALSLPATLGTTPITGHAA